jgi:hypothetical protein
LLADKELLTDLKEGEVKKDIKNEASPSLLYSHLKKNYTLDSFNDILARAIHTE